MTTENTTTYLLGQHGPLMSQSAVCALLRRTPAGLRKSIHTGAGWTRQIIAAQKHIGRRVFYRTAAIGEFIDSQATE